MLQKRQSGRHKPGVQRPSRHSGRRCKGACIAHKRLLALEASRFASTFLGKHQVCWRPRVDPGIDGAPGPAVHGNIDGVLVDQCQIISGTFPAKSVRLRGEQRVCCHVPGPVVHDNSDGRFVPGHGAAPCPVANGNSDGMFVGPGFDVDAGPVLRASANSDGMFMEHFRDDTPGSVARANGVGMMFADPCHDVAPGSVVRANSGGLGGVSGFPSSRRAPPRRAQYIDTFKEVMDFRGQPALFDISVLAVEGVISFVDNEFRPTRLLNKVGEAHSRLS